MYLSLNFAWTTSKKLLKRQYFAFDFSQLFQELEWAFTITHTKSICLFPLWTVNYETVWLLLTSIVINIRLPLQIKTERKSIMHIATTLTFRLPSHNVQF